MCVTSQHLQVLSANTFRIQSTKGLTAILFMMWSQAHVGADRIFEVFAVLFFFTRIICYGYIVYVDF